EHARSTPPRGVEQVPDRHSHHVHDEHLAAGDDRTNVAHNRRYDLATVIAPLLITSAFSLADVMMVVNMRRGSQPGRPNVKYLLLRSPEHQVNAMDAEPRCPAAAFTASISFRRRVTKPSGARPRPPRGRGAVVRLRGNVVAALNVWTTSACRLPT